MHRPANAGAAGVAGGQVETSRAPGSERSTSMATHSRVKSSMMFSVP